MPDLIPGTTNNAGLQGAGNGPPPGSGSGHWEWDPNTNANVWKPLGGPTIQPVAAGAQYNPHQAQPEGSYAGVQDNYIQQQILANQNRQNDPAAQAQAGQIDRLQLQPAMANGDQSRGQQVQALGLLGNAAQGNAPSAAQLQMAQGLNAAQTQGYGMANSARGGVGAQMAAQRQAQQGSAMLGQQAVNQSGQLRAQEMAQARGDFSQAASGLRGADQSQMNTMGQLGATDAALRGQTNMGNAQLQQQDKGLNAQIGQQTVADQTQLEALKAQAALQQQGLTQNYQLGLRGASQGDRRLDQAAGQQGIDIFGTILGAAGKGMAAGG